jgi:hypothetical protein
MLVASFVSVLLTLVPIAIDSSVPYASSSHLIVATVIALAAYGWHTALAGRPLLGAILLKDEPVRRASSATSRGFLEDESPRPDFTTRDCCRLYVEECAGRMLDNGCVSVMPHAMLARAALRPRRIRGRRARRSTSRLARRAFLAMRGAPLAVQIIVGTVLLVTLWAAVNWIVQVVRKPTEVSVVAGAVSGPLAKVPAQTWRQYGPLFDEHSTAVITPELLAALGQVESSGNPVARTYWRWRLSWNPFDLYGPASSAVGMFQITDGTFAEARRYCIHDHVVVEDGPWYDTRSCWFNALYTRVLPAHAVEMTAALLDRTVARILGRNRITSASLQQQQDLAAIAHLCGDGAGDGYARRGFRFTGGQRCGDHDPRRYLAQVNALKRQFARLADAD